MTARTASCRQIDWRLRICMQDTPTTSLTCDFSVYAFSGNTQLSSKNCAASENSGNGIEACASPGASATLGVANSRASENGMGGSAVAGVPGILARAAGARVVVSLTTITGNDGYGMKQGKSVVIISTGDNSVSREWSRRKFGPSHVTGKGVVTGKPSTRAEQSFPGYCRSARGVCGDDVGRAASLANWPGLRLNRPSTRPCPPTAVGEPGRPKFPVLAFFGGEFAVDLCFGGGSCRCSTPRVVLRQGGAQTKHGFAALAACASRREEATPQEESACRTCFASRRLPVFWR